MPRFNNLSDAECRHELDRLRLDTESLRRLSDEIFRELRDRDHLHFPRDLEKAIQGLQP